MSMPAGGVVAPGVPAASGGGVRRTGSAGLLVLVALLTMALLASVGFAVWAVARRADAAPAPVSLAMPAYAKDALAEAVPAAERVFSYDYRTFDADVKRGLEVCTGKFADEYRKTTNALRASARNGRSVVRAKVSVSGVVTAAPKRVEVLLFINQYRRNRSIQGEQVDENRVLLVLVPGADGSWLISEASAV